MMPFLLKVLVSALLVAGAAELARRYSVIGAMLASLPLTSILAMIWLWRDGMPPMQIAEFASGIFWLVLPSLLLFLVMPWMLRAGYGFWPSLGFGCVATAVAYGITVYTLRLWTQAG